MLEKGSRTSILDIKREIRAARSLFPSVLDSKKKMHICLSGPHSFLRKYFKEKKFTRKCIGREKKIKE